MTRPRYSYTPEVRHSGREFSSESEFHSHVRRAIIDSAHHQELVYTEVIPLWGENIVRFLNEAIEEKKNLSGKA